MLRVLVAFVSAAILVWTGRVCEGAAADHDSGRASAGEKSPFGQPDPIPEFDIKDIPTPPEPDAVPLYSGTPPGSPNASGATEQWNTLGGQRTVRNVTLPTLTPIIPARKRATGAAVVIAPGGAFLMLSMDNEGWPVARWFADQGVAAFVLKYRVDPTPRTDKEFADALDARFEAAGSGQHHFEERLAVADGKQAVLWVRAHASHWNIDPHRVGLIGFSAGAMTALGVALSNQTAARPDFLGLIYGPMDSVSVPVGAPPLFAALASDDPFFGNQGFGLIRSWQAAGRPVELHFYQQGGHGFGMGKLGTTSVGWSNEFMRWLGQVTR